MLAQDRQDVMRLSVRLTSRDSNRLCGSSVLGSEQTCSCDFSDVPGSELLAAHSLPTIIIAYFNFCNNNFHIGK
jgi:hypothetical protein